ncbi:MAG: RelA/SpoT domain-containing protein [Croceibacterium sp.]
MADYTACPHSKREIVGAGKALAGNIVYDQTALPDILETFRIAHSWRLANLYPMRRVRHELTGKIRAIKADAITAARLKRMVSIRKKLRTSPLTLYQMQDLGGCRAIISNQAELDRLVERYVVGDTPHAIVRDDDRIALPRHDTGYRGRHLTLKFNELHGRSDFDRHFIEVQFRTRLQHYWATAVEAVGLVRGEDLKGGGGNADWLRLFQLMAGEMAEDEGTAPVPSVSVEAPERRQELIDLNGRLGALRALAGYNSAIRHMEGFIGSAPYYLIQYDSIRREVNVRPFRAARLGSEQYADAERNTQINTVFVEVDKVADLREAYPNYFLDVEAFTARLRRTISPPPPPKAGRNLRAGRLFEDWKSWRERRML